MPTPVPRLRLRLTAAAETAVRSGHPWVYSEKIRESNRTGRAGELAVIYDRSDRFLALGIYDPDSALAVRILHRGAPVTLDPAWWKAHLEMALERRREYFSADTDGYRLINGESDGWPGLVLDRYADCLVLKLYTPAWLGSLRVPADSSTPALPGLQLVPLLQQTLNPARIVLRFSRNIADAARKAGFHDGQNLFGSDSAPSVLFRESGLRLEADVVLGQKTGFYLDQRENRRRIADMARGADVLNVFSFSGGFSVHAARGGARSVTDLDISPHALASARRNFSLNIDLPGFAATRHHQIQADAFEWLAQAPGESHDIVILDPPSLARREADRPGAIQAYQRLARLGADRVRSGGYLLAASCSAHVTESEFFSAVRSTLSASGRSWEEIGIEGHAPDHPASFPEARYLKALYARCRNPGGE